MVCAFSCSRSDERRTHFEGKTARVFGFFFVCLFVFFREGKAKLETPAAGPEDAAFRRVEQCSTAFPR